MRTVGNYKFCARFLINYKAQLFRILRCLIDIARLWNLGTFLFWISFGKLFLNYLWRTNLTVACVLVFLITFSILRQFATLPTFAFCLSCQRGMCHRRRRLGTTWICVEIHDISSSSSFGPHRHNPRPFVIISSSIPWVREPRRLHQATSLVWNYVPACRLPNFHPTQATSHIHRSPQFFSVFNLLCNLFFVYSLQFFLTIEGNKLVLRGVISWVIVEKLWAFRRFDYILLPRNTIVHDLCL